MSPQTADRHLSLVEALDLSPEEEIWIVIDTTTSEAWGWGYTPEAARASAAGRMRDVDQAGGPTLAGEETIPDHLDRCLCVPLRTEQEHALVLIAALGISGPPEPPKVAA